ncbi:hypothetical protein [Streptomyces sp. NPDC058674]|uniref:hypothetical protein n=1 Tax=Streptomyces sp. NPDC058674 TaxID=3346592 RepID=UPI00364FCE35
MTSIDPIEGVPAATAKTLREAMDRLLAGRPRRTDGRLIKDNLYKEAGVSRATMNRARAVLAEWDQRTKETGSRTQGEARRDEELHELRAEVKGLKRQRTELQAKVDAAATVIAALHHDNAALHELIGSRKGVVVSLNGPQGE